MTTKRALVVDDNNLNRRLAEAFLRRLGWNAAAVENGEQALEALAHNRYDLVLLDLRMPRVNGEQVCESIRRGLSLTSMPVVAYTAHSMPEERMRILASGFDGLLVKPISFSDMRSVCEQAAAIGEPI